MTTLIRGDDKGAAQNVLGIDTTSTRAANPRGEETAIASSVVSGPAATTAAAESTTPPRSSAVTVTPSIASSPSTAATVETSTVPPTTVEHIAPAGTAVSDGNLRFTLTSFACDVAVVGPDSTNLAPYGVFCSAGLIIENAGHEEAVYQPRSQVLRFKYGPRVVSDMNSTFWANHTPDWFSHTHGEPLPTDLAPGASATQNVVFDVPTEYVMDDMHTYIELHEFEGGPGVLTATN